MSSLIGLTTFLVLALLVRAEWAPLVEVDDAVRDALHHFALRHTTYVSVMRGLSDLGSALSWQIVTVVVAGVNLWRRHWRVAAFTVVAIGGSSLLNSLLKSLVARPRPVVPHPFVHLSGMSFPSGHAQAAATGSLVLLVVARHHLDVAGRRIAIALSAVTTVAIAFSRVALAAHYATDVVAGVVVGAVWVALMSAAFGVRGRPA